MPEPASNDQGKAEALQAVAANLATRPNEPFMSSTARMLKAFANAPENALIEARVARTYNQAKKSLDSSLMQLTGDISATLERMTESKAAAFHAQLKQEYDPLKEQANQQQREAEALVQSIETLSQTSRRQLSELQSLPRIERQTKSRALEDQEQALALKARNLQDSIDTTTERLHNLHGRAYNLLPASDKSGLPAPVSVKDNASTAPKLE